MRRLLLLALALAVIAGGVTLWLWRGAGPLEAPATIEITEGLNLGGAARVLARAHAIRSPTLFRHLAARFGSSDPIRAGEYLLPAHASYAAILDVLQHGRALQRLVTITEGMPSVMVRDKLMVAPYLTGTVAVPPEGGVLPDSYAYGRGETRLALLQRMRRAMDRTLASLWAKRGPEAAVKSPREALILASIVEKETGVASERGLVAAVYSNRLRIGMPLQADPTVIYPVTQGRPLGRRILFSELHAANGYNTYARRGLPVGPICNPGRAAIAAVLHPAASRAIYFVADGTGGHAFADTLAQHDANVKKWYAIRRARGEM